MINAFPNPGKTFGVTPAEPVQLPSGGFAQRPRGRGMEKTRRETVSTLHRDRG